jgi:hypothetical protein
MIIGYAICDLDAKHDNIEKSLISIPSNAIEIQREGNSWDNKTLKKVTNNYDFISVHAPTRYVDISSNDKGMLDRSRQKTLKAMQLAHEINANIFVVHPVHYEGWMEPKERNERRTTFIQTFQDHLVPYYLDNFHNYKIAIENIEYSKYPATLEETAELHATLSGTHPVGIVLDIAHIWNSRRMLAENPHLNDKVYGYPWTPEILHDYVEKFIRHNEDNIVLYHVANFGTEPIRTHDPINSDSINPELQKLIPILKRKPIIMEIYGQEYDILNESKRTIEEIANE